MLLTSDEVGFLCVVVEMMESFTPRGLEAVMTSARGWEPENTETTSGLETASDCDCDQLTSILGPGEAEATWSRELRGCDPNTDNSERGTGAPA